MDKIKPSEETLIVAFAQLCRTCLCEGEMCNISEIYIAGKNSSELSSLYASVQIEPNDDLPQRMCLNCIDELMRVDLFVKKCKVSDRTLRDIKTEVKTEPHDLCDVEPEFVECEQPNTLRGFETDPENCDIGVELLADDQQSALGDIKTEPEDGCIVGLEFVAYDQLNTNVPSGNTCSFCSETFGSSVELRSHRLEMKHFKVYKCSFCEETCTTNSALLKHMRVHSEENPNASETCGKVPFTPLESMKEKPEASETFEHTSEQLNQWETCQKNFSSLGNLNIHQKIHLGIKDFECEHCKKCFVQKECLIKHQKVHLGVKEFECSHCNKCFSLSNLNTHQKIHLGIKDFECEHCKKCFVEKECLIKHLQKECPIKHLQKECPIKHLQKECLVNHQTTHLSVKDFECLHCKKCFSTKMCLFKHLKVHVKDFKCEHCEMCFKYNHQLEDHRKIHLGHKDFECEHCEKRFLRKRNLRRHRRIHSEVQRP